ncbi:MAG: glycoside hydrolase family 9 protein [Gammaproteobacteria bacterium]|nr:glycoside hydrolase family 9 protein [Gammaproteobacteria bacterium]MBU1654480.1 glycoside hydrolase family 9 protein [Gammaproteobacteria bacterium]MBU1960132.1 glycoside hydrolase family 9 protein [Gammaproteobacteria bacterium]
MKRWQRLVLFVAVLPSIAAMAAAPEPIRLVSNQIGYLPDWPKVAMLIGGPPKAEGGEAEVLTADSGASVLRVPLSPARQDPQTGDVVRTFDFSRLRKPGRYLLRVGQAESYPFEIGETLYQEPLKTLLRSYFLQRCGVAISDHMTKVAHAACHTQDGVLAQADALHKEGDRVAAMGGWHDAGDYGKYVATTAVTAGRLLAMYERHPALYPDRQLDIPESGNNIPDLLDEMKVGLDWMLSMQRADGAVYRKLSGKAWPHDTAPDADTQPRFLYGITTPETAKAVAAWAMAARIYKEYLPRQSELYLEAARKGWRFLEKTPEQLFDYHEGDNSGSGPYMQNKTDVEEDLSHDWDDRLWAAVELYITTGEKPWADYVAAKMPDAPLRLFEWKNPAALGMENYLLHPNVRDPLGLRDRIRQKIIDRAETVMENRAYSGYRIANPRFIWGSNKMTAEEGIIMLLAYQLTGKRRYLEAAIDQIDYLLGRNHFNLSFASGIGANPVTHPTHIFARAAKISIPGLFVGGPNALEQSEVGPKFKGPLSYIDDGRSYATNEYAIDYNASFIALLGQATATARIDK